MGEEGISIFELDQHLSEFSDAIRALLVPDFDDYGISLEKIMVTTVMRPEGEEQYRNLKNFISVSTRISEKLKSISRKK